MQRRKAAWKPAAGKEDGNGKKGGKWWEGSHHVLAMLRD